MWPQRWLGEAYGSLYWEFERGTFTLADARQLLKMKESNLNVAFSMLHKAGTLIVFARGRPRTYRLLDPRSFVLKTSGQVREAEFAQEQYVQLVYDAARALRQHIRMTSLCVFGSVARGKANRSSDVDLLVISDDFRGSIASRIDSLSFVDREVQEEVRFLRERGHTTAVNVMPLRSEEAELGPVFLLDLAAGAKILLDEGEFLGGLLTKLRARLDLAGARRVETERGWYWDLKPDYKRGEREVVI